MVVVVLLPCRGVRDADLLSRLSFAISTSVWTGDLAIEGDPNLGAGSALVAGK